MKYFSAFTGVGGFDMGMPKNWECVGHSEVDKYANMVLKYRYKDVKNYGDIEKIEWNGIPDFDMLVGGTPCQDLSIAGKREGLGGRRSGLFFEFIRGLREKQPRYFLWENVKGALSSSHGWDFARVLLEFSEAGYDLWWQVLDATWFGIPQHRERIFVLGTLGGKRFREVFFKPKNGGTDTGLHENNGLNIKIMPINPEQTQSRKIYDPSNGNMATLNGISHGGIAKPKIALPVLEPAFKTIRANGRRVKDDGNPAFTIRTAVRNGVAIPVLTPDRIKKRQNGRRIKTEGEPAFTLISQDRHGIFDGMIIRYLTPLECERLMGWPDDHTRYGIDEKGNTLEISDNSRYNLIGNGVVPQVVRAIIEKVVE